MKSSRYRYWVFFVAAMFLANNAAAFARACNVQLAAPERTAVRTLDAGGNAPLCPGVESSASCLAHVTGIHKGNQDYLFSDAPPIAVAAPVLLGGIRFAGGPKRVVVAADPPIVGPPLTILFRRFRN